MFDFKRILIINGLIIIAAINIFNYWNSSLHSRAVKVENDEQKIEILDGVVYFYLTNDLVFYELAKAHLNMGINKIGDSASSGKYLREAVKNFKRAIRINPTSYDSHFGLARSLLYLSYLSPDLDANSTEELIKAATLAGENSQIFYEVARVFLSRWSQLTNDDKNFVLSILKKIVITRDREKLNSILNLWEMNIKDYSVMDKILSEDPHIYMIYANFLGEKSLSLKERHKVLTRAEFLRFQEAREEYALGEREFFSFHVPEATDHYKSCLNILRKIKFYQNFSEYNLIDLNEYNTLLKSSLLSLVKAEIRQGKELKDVEDYIREYLEREDDMAAINDLESYLKYQKLIGENLEEGINTLDRLSFELYLYLKENKQLDIMKIGNLLKESFIVIPENKKKAYEKILRVMGDSYQKSGSIYSAEDMYQKVLALSPDDLETLVKLRRNYEKLRSEEKLQEINERIAKIVTPKEKIFKNSSVRKGKQLSRAIVLDGQNTLLNLYLSYDDKEKSPLISVFFNGYVVWENYLKGDVISISVKTKIGRNVLIVSPLNKAITVTKLEYQLNP